MQTADIPLTEFEGRIPKGRAKSPELLRIRSMNPTEALWLIPESIACRTTVGGRVDCSVRGIVYRLNRNNADKFWIMRHDKLSRRHYIACYAILDGAQ